MIKRAYIDNEDGGQIHYAEIGTPSSDHPSILLLHQTPRSWDEFREVMEALGEEFHLIAMDLPGMGASCLPSKPASIQLYAHAAAQIIQHFNAEPMTICGHHTGGAVTIELAANYSSFVDSIVLSSAPWLNSDIRKKRLSHSSIDTVKLSHSGDHLIDLWNQRRPYYPANIDYMVRFMRDALKTENPATGHRAVTEYHMEDTFGKVSCPVLIIEHMKDIFAAKHMDKLKSAFPKASVKKIPEGLIPLEATAQEFSEILRNWANSQ